MSDAPGAAFNAASYEEKHRRGFGLVYPESHIVRVHRHILEWELKIAGGSILDFGCGPGAHLRYFADQGFVPYGCDVSETAIQRARETLSEFPQNLKVNPVDPDLRTLFPGLTLDVFLSNQVLYYLSDASIHRLVSQVSEMMRPGGAFIATMMAPTCWYTRKTIGKSGDFTRLEVDSPRQHEITDVNLKDGAELPALFRPFQPLHLGFYTWQIRQEEGRHDHWLYVGVKR